MTFIQTVVPDPFIPCKPGWCLMYVRQAFGAPAVEPTATAGWFAAKKRHTDMDFPEGCWVPLWFELEKEPAGHVVLRSPDGSIYSTTSPYGDKATHHPDLDDLFRAYSYNNPLTYRGWSEDISGVTVVEESTINYESITIPGDEDFMSALNDEEQRELLGKVRMNNEMIGNVGNAINTLSFAVAGVADAVNSGKPVSQESMENIRKLTNKLVYGVAAE